MSCGTLPPVRSRQRLFKCVTVTALLAWSPSRRGNQTKFLLYKYRKHPRISPNNERFYISSHRKNPTCALVLAWPDFFSKHRKLLVVTEVYARIGSLLDRHVNLPPITCSPLNLRWPSVSQHLKSRHLLGQLLGNLMKEQAVGSQTAWWLTLAGPLRPPDRSRTSGKGATKFPWPPPVASDPR
jgi:hypothetical protein